MRAQAAGLLWTLLEGLIWRSRVTHRGLRRVNYFIKNLLQERRFATEDDVLSPDT